MRDLAPISIYRGTTDLMRHTGKHTDTTTTEDAIFACFVIRLLAPVTLTGHQGPHVAKQANSSQHGDSQDGIICLHPSRDV